MSTNHKDREHAPLSPSSAKRWISCPGSYTASEGIETITSEAALEGIEAHEWAEKLIDACVKDNEKLYEKILRKLTKKDEDMAYHVDNYINFLDTLKTNFQNENFGDYEEYIERRVDFTENVWGTLDWACVRKNADSIHAITVDLKYGRGVYVDVEDTPQLIIYLICLEEYLKVRFDKAWTYIYQPRIQKDKPYERMCLTRKDIDAWREKILAAEKVCLDMKAGTIPLRFEAGDHCRFCPAQVGCKTFREYAQHGTLKIIDKVETLPAAEAISIDTLVEIHKKKKQIEHFLENVDHFLLLRGMNGLSIGNLKVVEGRSNRRWIDDEDKVARDLRMAGVQPYTKKLRNITEIEKILGKNTINHLTDKPPGKLQLVSQEDERPIAKLGKDSLALMQNIKTSD